MTSIRPGSVVIGVDGSPHSDAGLAWAVAYAALVSRPVLIVHATGRLGAGKPLGGLTAAQPGRDAPCARVTEEARSLALRMMPGLEVETVIAGGDARQVLTELSQQAAMLVVGTRGHGPVTSLLLGSVGHAVVLHADCSVAVVRPKDTPPAGVVVGVAGDGSDRLPLEFAAGLAALRGTVLDAVHAWRPIDSLAHALTAAQRAEMMRQHERALAEALAGLEEKFPDVQVNRHLPEHKAVGALVDRAEGASCVVVGAHGIDRGRGTLGSMTRSVVEHAPVTVVVVRG
jgi:nucleotide-binding universal stress UspA family protein